MRFYFTTPIYYVNDAPHIGHAYTTIVADVLARYHRLFNDETYFLTGTDEHGQKVETAAKKRNLAPQDHCDDMVKNFEKIWAELNISNDIFMRTTFPYHKQAVQACLQKLWDAKEIYAEDYEGWYSVSEEIFYTEKDLVNGKTPQGNEVVKIKEKNYFFKMSKYQEWLIDYIQKNPDFIQPESKKNEVLGFLRKPLHDLCISRPKSRLSWGIELPFDKDYVTYVWFDALLNYPTAVGLEQNEKAADFKKWWGEGSGAGNAVHLLGKDILMTHAVYWPTMLKALGVAQPRTIFAHGWWLTDSGEKMSKSKGAVVRPLDVKDMVGVDPLRYFLTRDIIFGSDAAFSVDLVLSRVNSDLANNLGNLFSRSVSILEKNCGGTVPEYSVDKVPGSKALQASVEKLPALVKSKINSFEPQAAVEEIMGVLTETNKYFSDSAPWNLFKTDAEKGKEVLYMTLESLRLCAVLLQPVMPTKMRELLTALGSGHALTWEKDVAGGFGRLKPGTKIEKPAPLFPRVEAPKTE